MLNAIGQDRAWLRLRLVGTASNRDAYGARIAILRRDLPPLWRRVHTDGSYLSAGDPRVLVGLGGADEVEGVGVVWPSGRREWFAVPGKRQDVLLTEGAGQDWKSHP